MAVVVANEPIPSVSKKLVAAPTPSCSAVGKRPSVAGDSDFGAGARLTNRPGPTAEINGCQRAERHEQSCDRVHA